MARRAEGWKLKRVGDIWRVRFTFKARRYEITTGERVSAKAEIIAARIYSDVVAGRLNVARSGVLVHPATPIEELVAKWLTAIEPEIGRKTPTTYTVYGRHWTKHFVTIGGLDSASSASYGRERLKSVQRETVIKELSALRRFMLWLVDEGFMRQVLEMRAPSKKAHGKKHKQGRGTATQITPEQAEAILALLPEQSRSRDGKRWPIRDRFTFGYETGLRPEAIDLFEERDLTVFGLHIRAELDKNRWDRTIPLSDRARACLERNLKGEETRRIFGSHDRRASWRKATIAALGPDGARVNPYDLKHARVTLWISEGKDLMGIRFLTGVDEALERYAHPSRGAADRVLWGDSGAQTGSSSAKGGTRTLTGVTPLAPQARSGIVSRRDPEGWDSVDHAEFRRVVGLSGAVPQFTPGAP